LNRRNFLQFAVVAVGVAVGAGVLPFPIAAVEDGYSEKFFSRVRDKIILIVRETGRAPRNLEIDPPELVDGQLVRTVHLRLEIGSSLLDNNFFVWDEAVPGMGF
jgi:hypothetical protein